MQMPLPLDADPLALDADSLDDPPGHVNCDEFWEVNLQPCEQNDTQM